MNHEVYIICPNCGHEYDARLHFLVCPKCGFAHTEPMKADMIRCGAYVHKYPDRTLELGFQVGLLASQFESAS